MRLHISNVNGSGPKVRAYLTQALPAVEIVINSEGGDEREVTATLEVSEFDNFVALPAILERAGRNIVQAIGSGVRVHCHVDRSPDIRWTNNPNGDSW